MTTLSLGKVCVDVKIPNVIRKQRSVLRKALFVYLFKQSNNQGIFRLDATQIARELGYTRRAIYKAIKFLCNVNLVRCVIARTGRGHHSTYWLNWRKFGQKCERLSNKTKSKNHIHDRSMPVQNAQREQTAWTKRMGAFRELIDQTTLVKSEREYSLCLIGKCVRTKSTEWARELYHRLAHRLYMLEPPNWVLEVRQFYAWLQSLINGLMEGVTA